MLYYYLLLYHLEKKYSYKLNITWYLLKVIYLPGRKCAEIEMMSYRFPIYFFLDIYKERNILFG
jgi:hypothetical protein